MSGAHGIRRRTEMKRTAALVAIAVGTFGFAGPARAHEGGHRGGCEDFGHINRLIGKNPGAYGFPAARHLGDAVSSLAGRKDGRPGVADVVESIDHAGCGEG
jgi:hypothetical protein